jgi:hypothetical protein
MIQYSPPWYLVLSATGVQDYTSNSPIVDKNSVQTLENLQTKERWYNERRLTARSDWGTNLPRLRQALRCNWWHLQQKPTRRENVLEIINAEASILSSL